MMVENEERKSVSKWKNKWIMTKSIFFLCFIARSAAPMLHGIRHGRGDRVQFLPWVGEVAMVVKNFSSVHLCYIFFQ